VNTLADKLNEILADEWACVRALRRAEPACDDPGKLEVIKRVRKDCSVNCVNLAGVVRAIGGRPTDIPSPRFSLKLREESLTEIIDLAQSAQRHIVAEIGALVDEPELKTSRVALDSVVRLHREDVIFLDKSGVSG